MSFLCKQPSIVPRVLCDSECPPFDEDHVIENYPVFYNPLYFPCYYQLLFSTGPNVCAWLLKGLQDHFVSSCLCPKTKFCPDEFDESDDVCYNSAFFDIKIQGVRFQVPLVFVESVSFSFCHLYRRILIQKFKISSLISNDVDLWTLDARKKNSEIPIWFVRDREVFSELLSSLSLSELHEVDHSLHLSRVRRKSDLIELIIDDFVEERLRIWDIVTCCNAPCIFSIPHHLSDRYGSNVLRALRDLRSFDHFQQVDFNSDRLNAFDDSGEWFSQSFDEMSMKIARSSKESVLQSLHLIPYYLRPRYETKSMRACWIPLLLHIRKRLLYLTRLYKIFSKYNYIYEREPGTSAPRRYDWQKS